MRVHSHVPHARGSWRAVGGDGLQLREERVGGAHVRLRHPTPPPSVRHISSFDPHRPTPSRQCSIGVCGTPGTLTLTLTLTINLTQVTPAVVWSARRRTLDPASVPWSTTAPIHPHPQPAAVPFPHRLSHPHMLPTKRVHDDAHGSTSTVSHQSPFLHQPSRQAQAWTRLDDFIASAMSGAPVTLLA